tara:strand:+ start:946 stop:1302 length:357 start_codon:yes stop_codon:yes gene_type:complete
MQATIGYRNVSVSSTAILVKAGNVRLPYIGCSNKSVDDIWLHLYNKATAGAVTVGTTTPDQSYLVPQGDGTNYSVREPIHGGDEMVFPLGLVIAATKEADGGNTAPASSQIVNARYSA